MLSIICFVIVIVQKVQQSIRDRLSPITIFFCSFEEN
jgi:hypothetical protein